jgi:hypothetical protein
MAQKFALVTLANYADDCGVCWPEQKTLSDDCACSARTMRDALAELQQAGLISRLMRRRRDGSRRSDVFLLIGFAARKPILRADDHPVLTAADVADLTAAAAANRQNLPVDDPENSADQPADGAAPTGKICHINRQNLPVTIMQEPPFEPSEELPEKQKEEEGACAAASFDFEAQISDAEPGPDTSQPDPQPGPGATPPPPASDLAVLLRRVLVAVNHDPDGDLPHWWTGPGVITALTAWRHLGLSDDQIALCAVESRRGNPVPPNGPRALDRPMQRLAASLAKRAGRPAVITPEQAAEARRRTLETYAEWVRDKPGLAANLVRLDDADAMLRAGLVTPDDLRGACVSFRRGPGSVCARLFPDFAT